MIEYTLVLFEKLVQVLKVVIPLYILFDITGDLLWKRS